MSAIKYSELLRTKLFQISRLTYLINKYNYYLGASWKTRNIFCKQMLSYCFYKKSFLAWVLCSLVWYRIINKTITNHDECSLVLLKLSTLTDLLICCLKVSLARWPQFALLSSLLLGPVTYIITMKCLEAVKMIKGTPVNIDYTCRNAKAHV